MMAHCVKCHHEWIVIYKDAVDLTCDWCGESGYIIEKDTSWDRYGLKGVKQSIVKKKAKNRAKSQSGSQGQRQRSGEEKMILDYSDIADFIYMVFDQFLDADIRELSQCLIEQYGV